MTENKLLIPYINKILKRKIKKVTYEIQLELTNMNLSTKDIAVLKNVLLWSDFNLYRKHLNLPFFLRYKKYMDWHTVSINLNQIIQSIPWKNFFYEFKDYIIYHNISSPVFNKLFNKEFLIENSSVIGEKINDLIDHRNFKENDLIDIIEHYPKSILSWLTITSEPLSENLIRKYQDYFNYECWQYISRNSVLSQTFIEEFSDKLDWSYLSQYQVLTEDFMRKHQDKIYWEEIAYCQDISEEFIEEFADKLEWHDVSTLCLSEDFIRRNKHRIIWDSLNLSSLSEAFLDEFNELIDFNDLPYHRLSEQFYEKYLDRIPRDAFNRSATLSVDFINKHKEYIDWYDFSGNFNLTEEIIENFKENIIFNRIEIPLSEKFIMKYWHKLSFNRIQYKKNPSIEFIKIFKDKIPYYQYIHSISLEEKRKLKSILYKYIINQKSKCII